MSQAAFDELRVRLAELSDLGRIMALVAWDQQVLMPVRGAATRAEQRATLARIAHQKFTAPEVGKLLAENAKTQKTNEKTAVLKESFDLNIAAIGFTGNIIIRCVHYQPAEAKSRAPSKQASACRSEKQTVVCRTL